jgi:hypothetical protein
LRPDGNGVDRNYRRIVTNSSLDGAALMVIISLKLSMAGGWKICRSHIALFSDLQLGAAIKLARDVARDEHQRSGRSVRVEMPGLTSTIVLARYTDDGDVRVDGTLVAA